VVDRLEELLAQMADEDDEEQEDALSLEAASAASAPRAEDLPARPGDVEHREGPGQAEDPAALAPTERYLGGDEAAAEEFAPQRGPAERSEGAAQMAGKGWPESPGIRLGAEQSGKPAGPFAAETDTETASAADGTAERGLEELYRRTAQASRPAVRTLPVEQAGRTLRAEEPGRTAELTMDELDRAVRRDSRRYDGGMSIF